MKLAASSTWLVLAFLFQFACSNSPDNQRVQASYDKTSGKLLQLVVDGATDGRPNIFSYMDGPKFVRVEIDKDEDGKIDRWEYYGADQRIERVGVSRLNDGVADAWVFEAPDGTIGRMEISTRRDGKPDRFEFYEKGAIVRAEQDTNGDGRLDKWELYKGGALTAVSFDTKGTGSPDTTINYEAPAK